MCRPTGPFSRLSRRANRWTIATEPKSLRGHWRGGLFQKLGSLLGLTSCGQRGDQKSSVSHSRLKSRSLISFRPKGGDRAALDGSIAQLPHFETYWAASHDMRFEPAARMYDIPYFSFDAMERVFQEGRSAIIELITDRTANYKYQLSRGKPRSASNCSLVRPGAAGVSIK